MIKTLIIDKGVREFYIYVEVFNVDLFADRIIEKRLFMRIIAGTARGIPLKSPSNADIRPTLDRVRESLFNMLAPFIEESRFLDLYAGTGAIGIEALSRGAKLAVFIDQSSEATDLVQQNLSKTKLNTKGKIKKARLPQSIKSLGIKTNFDIIFADPPYEVSDLTPLLNEINVSKILDAKGILIIEHNVKVSPPDREGALQLVRTKVYGVTQMSWYEMTAQ